MELPWRLRNLCTKPTIYSYVGRSPRISRRPVRLEAALADFLEATGTMLLGSEIGAVLAELAHKQARQFLSIAGEDSPRINDLFHQKYRGSRYSFGYPACPNLEDQA